jgi:hypothetical protein
VAARLQVKAMEAGATWAEAQAPAMAAQITEAEETLDLARLIGNPEVMAAAEQRLDTVKSAALLLADVARRSRELAAALRAL